MVCNYNLMSMVIYKFKISFSENFVSEKYKVKKNLDSVDNHLLDSFTACPTCCHTNPLKKIV